MNTEKSVERISSSSSHDWLHAVLHYLGNWRALMALGTLAAIIGVALNWSSLVAAGIAPILLAMLPCAVMCGLGLCMNRLSGNSCAPQQSPPQAPEKEEPRNGR